ncbi:CAAX prenyl protease-related protein [Duganella flavida]|uniref:CAAX prenyl protease-related protein n=1 Tax=Duganella flavida TaxID=2692175 RepID=UPI003530EB19
MLSRAAWARVLPFLTYIGFIVLADLLQRAGWDAAQLRWLYPLKIGLVLGLLVLFWRDYDELRAGLPSARALVAALLLGVLVWWLWIRLDAGWMVVGQSDGYDPRQDGMIAWPLAIVRLAGAALVVPVMEELFWRSFLMRWLTAEQFQTVAPAHVGVRGFVITMLLFGVEHNLWLAGIVAGAVYGLIYMRSGNLWAAIGAHAVTNGVLGVWIISTNSWSYW